MLLKCLLIIFKLLVSNRHNMNNQIMTEFIMGNLEILENDFFYKEEAAYLVVRVTGYRDLNPNQTWMCVECRIPF